VLLKEMKALLSVVAEESLQAGKPHMLSKALQRSSTLLKVTFALLLLATSRLTKQL
jgi:hypothetical protein